MEFQPWAVYSEDAGQFCATGQPEPEQGVVGVLAPGNPQNQQNEPLQYQFLTTAQPTTNRDSKVNQAAASAPPTGDDSDSSDDSESGDASDGVPRQFEDEGSEGGPGCCLIFLLVLLICAAVGSVVGGLKSCLELDLGGSDMIGAVGSLVSGFASCLGHGKQRASFRGGAPIPRVKVNGEMTFWIYDKNGDEEKYLRYVGEMKHINAYALSEYGSIDGDAFQRKWNEGGDYWDSSYNGVGKLFLASGKTYEGNFVNGELHGLGEERDENDRVVYTGNWTNGKPDRQDRRPLQPVKKAGSGARCPEDDMRRAEADMLDARTRAISDIIDRYSSRDLGTPDDPTDATENIKRSGVERETIDEASVQESVSSSLGPSACPADKTTAKPKTPSTRPRLFGAPGQIVAKEAEAEDCKVPRVLVGNFDGKYSGIDKYSGIGKFTSLRRNQECSRVHVTQEGEFVNGKLHGMGVEEEKDGKCRRVLYIGEWQRGRPHGHGTWTKWDFSRTTKGSTSCQPLKRYVGEFVDGERHGAGVYEFRDGNLEDGHAFDGNWEHDHMQGQGTEWYRDKHGKELKYEGQFANDKRNGSGVLSCAKGGEIYNGIWKNGQPDGQIACPFSDQRWSFCYTGCGCQRVGGSHRLWVDMEIIG